MSLLGRPDEVVVRDLEPPPDARPELGELVHERLGLRLPALGLLRDALAVLVHPDHEVDVVPEGPSVPRDYIRADLLERVARVRLAVRVVDRRGEVEAGHGPRVVLSGW